MGRKRRSLSIALCLGAFSCGVVGCVTRVYDSPARPRSDVARLERAVGSADGAVQRQPVWFVSVDDRSMNRDRDADVLAGPHVVVLEVLWINGFREQVTMAFEAEADRTYRFHAQTRDPDYDTGDLVRDSGGIVFTPWHWGWFRKPGEGRPSDLDTAVWVIDPESESVVWGAKPEWALRW